MLLLGHCLFCCCSHRVVVFFVYVLLSLDFSVSCYMGSFFLVSLFSFSVVGSFVVDYFLLLFFVV